MIRIKELSFYTMDKKALVTSSDAVSDAMRVIQTTTGESGTFVSTSWDNKVPIKKGVSLEGQFNQLFLQVSDNLLYARPALTEENKSVFLAWASAVNTIRNDLQKDPMTTKYIDDISAYVTDNAGLHKGLLAHTLDNKVWLQPFYRATQQEVDSNFILASFGAEDDDSVSNIYNAFTGLYRIALVYGAYKDNPDLRQIISLITSVAKPNMTKQDILASIIPLIGPNSNLKTILFKIFQSQDDSYLDTLASKLQLVLETIDPSYSELNVGNMLHTMCGTQPPAKDEGEKQTEVKQDDTVEDPETSFAEFESAFEKFSPIMTAVLTQCAKRNEGEGLSMQSMLPMITALMRETSV